MTVGGAKALEVELLRLKDVERPRIVNDIATARQHGDLKENAEYHAAKDDQGFIEGGGGGAYSRNRIKTFSNAIDRCYTT